MDIQLKEVEYCKLMIECTGSIEDIASAENKVLGFFKDQPVPGFRKGSAPKTAIKHHFKKQMKDFVKHELMQQAYEISLDEHNIRPFGNPDFLSSRCEKNKFSCSFNLHKLPEVKLEQYKGFDIPKGTVQDPDTLAEKIVQELRVLHGDTLRYEDNDFVQTGDSVMISYEGFVEGTENPVIKMENENFIVGQAQVDAFNENLLGMTIGETREFSVLMPEASAAAHIAGKNVRFVLELVMASKRILPALDDLFAQRVGLKTVDELLAQAKATASTKSEEYKTRHLMDQVSNRLIEAHKFEVPNWITANEAKVLAARNQTNWENLPDQARENFVKFASNNVKLSLILDAVRNEEPEAQLTDTEVQMHLVNDIHNYRQLIPNGQDKTPEELFKKLAESGYLPSIVTAIKDEHTLKFLISESNIIE